MAFSFGRNFRLLLLTSGAAALAACGGEQAEPTYEAGVADESGELIVTDPQTPAVDVTLPEAPMTNVPANEADAATDAPTPAPAE